MESIAARHFADQFRRRTGASLVFLRGLPLRDDLDSRGRNRRLIRFDNRQIVRQVLQKEVAILNLHRRTDVNLDAENPLQGPVLLIEIDYVHGGMIVDPVLMMVAANENPEGMPLAGLEILDGQLIDNP